MQAMQPDAEGLEILTQIANRRAYLAGMSKAASGMSIRRVFLRREQMEAEIATLTTRWLNHGLKAAGLPHAIDPATQPLPVCEQRHPRIFAPERGQAKALEIPEMHK